MERFAVVAGLVQTDTVDRKPDWVASFAECVDSPPVPAAAKPVCSEYLARSDVAASNDLAASLADEDCAEWIPWARTLVACSVERNSQLRLHSQLLPRPQLLPRLL